jgi:hypothetical protein
MMDHIPNVLPGTNLHLGRTVEMHQWLDSDPPPIARGRKGFQPGAYMGQALLAM